MKNQNTVGQFLNKVSESSTVGVALTIETFLNHELTVLTGGGHEYIVVFSTEEFVDHGNGPSKTMIGNTPHLDREVGIELFRLSDGFVVSIKTKEGDTSYHRCMVEQKDEQAYITRSNKLRGSLQVLGIKRCSEGLTEITHRDFTIRLPVEYNCVFNGTDRRGLGYDGVRYGLDGTQDTVNVLITYSLGEGHNVILTDSNCRRQYSLVVMEESTMVTELPVVKAVKTNKEEVVLVTVDEKYAYRVIERYENLKDFSRFGTIGRKGVRFIVVPGNPSDTAEVYLTFSESEGNLIMRVIKDGTHAGTYRVQFTDAHIPNEEVQEEESVSGLPNIEDVRKKTDDALQISISRIGDAITEASSLGERTVIVPKEEFPNSSVNRIKEELEKAGYEVSRIPLGGLVINW